MLTHAVLIIPPPLPKGYLLTQVLDAVRWLWESQSHLLWLGVGGGGVVILVVGVWAVLAWKFRREAQRRDQSISF